MPRLQGGATRTNRGIDSARSRAGILTRTVESEAEAAYSAPCIGLGSPKASPAPLPALSGLSSLTQQATRGPAPQPTMYDPQLVQPMRDELTALGIKELLTPEDVDAAMKSEGTTLVVVNSVCGCAAGSARPAVRLALMNGKKPDNVVTVFAGMEADATARAREYFKPYRPSSPQMALMKDGQLLEMVQRQDIEGKQPDQLAQDLSAAFDKHC